MIKLNSETYINPRHITSVVDLGGGWTRINSLGDHRVEVDVPIEGVIKKIEAARD